MNNSAYIGMLSILLALTMIFALQSVQEKESAIEVHPGEYCQGGRSCCFTCFSHSLSVNADGTVQYDGRTTTPEEFGHHLSINHAECEALHVSIDAHKDIQHNVVVNVSKIIKTVSPSALIVWGDDN